MFVLSCPWCVLDLPRELKEQSTVCYSIPVGTSHLDNSGCYSRTPHRQFAPWGHVCNMNGKFKAVMSLSFQLLATDSSAAVRSGSQHKSWYTYTLSLVSSMKSHMCIHKTEPPKRNILHQVFLFFELLKNFFYFHIDLILLPFWLFFDLILLSLLLISKKHKLTLSHWVAGWFDSHPSRSQFLLSGCRPLVPKCRKSHALLQQPSINQIKINIF